MVVDVQIKFALSYIIEFIVAGCNIVIAPNTPAFSIGAHKILGLNIFNIAT